MNKKHCLSTVALIIAQQLSGANPLALNQSLGATYNASTDHYHAHIKILDEKASSQFFGNNAMTAQFLARVNGIAQRSQNTYQSFKTLHHRYAPVITTIRNISSAPLCLPINHYVQGLEGALVDPQSIAQQYPALSGWAWATGIAAGATTSGILWYCGQHTENPPISEGASNPFGNHVFWNYIHYVLYGITSPGFILSDPTSLKAISKNSSVYAAISSPVVLSLLCHAIRATLKKQAQLLNPPLIKLANETIQTKPDTVNDLIIIPAGATLSHTCFVDRSLVSNNPLTLTVLQGQDLQATT